jgi:FixJ family two-component response regulator
MYERNRREIASELGIAPSTVDSYRQRLEERTERARVLLEVVESGETSV